MLKQHLALVKIKTTQETLPEKDEFPCGKIPEKDEYRCDEFGIKIVEANTIGKDPHERLVHPKPDDPNEGENGEFSQSIFKSAGGKDYQDAEDIVDGRTDQIGNGG